MGGIKEVKKIFLLTITIREKMFTWFTKKTLFFKTVIIAVIAQFMFLNSPAYSLHDFDNLRPDSRMQRDGGEGLKDELLIKDYKNKIKGLKSKQVLGTGEAAYEGQSASLMNLVDELITQNLNKDYLLEVISTAIGMINSNTELYLEKYFNNPLVKSQEANLIDFSVDVIKETGVLIKKCDFKLTLKEIGWLEGEVNLLEAEAGMKLLPSLNELKLIAQRDGGSFLQIIPQNVHKGKGLADVGSGLTIEQLLALGLESAFLGHTAMRERYIREAVEGLGKTRSEAFTRLDEFINDRIKELLKHEQIKEIHLGVGSEGKNIKIEQEMQDINDQLNIDFKDVKLADLQRVNFDISYEPSVDIKPIKDEDLKEMVRSVHQFIYDWFAGKYGDENINAIWGKNLKVWFRGSVVKDKNKDNATPIMSVKVKTKENKELPGVHGVVFATSGKKVEGYLGAAQVVQNAAQRDSEEYGIGFQYGILVNFKSITADDKERTPPDEYVNWIYAALIYGKLNRKYILAQVAPPDIELNDWLSLIAKAEASTGVEMKWIQLAQESNIPIEKLTDFYKKSIAYQDSEKRSSEVFGIEEFRKFIVTVKKMQEAKQKSSRDKGIAISLNSDYSEDKGTLVKIVLRTGGAEVKDEFSSKDIFGLDELTGYESRIREILEKGDFDLTKKEDFEKIKEKIDGVYNNEVFGYNNRKSALLSYTVSRIDSALSKLRDELIIKANKTLAAVIIEAGDFNSPSMYSTVFETLSLSGVNIGIFGQGADNLKILLGKSENIISAGTYDELVLKLTALPFSLKPSNIRVVKATDTPTIVMAAAITSLFDTEVFTLAFSDFCDAMLATGVVKPETYDTTIEAVNNEIMDVQMAVQQSEVILAIELPKIELPQELKQTIQAEKQVVSEFMASIGV